MYRTTSIRFDGSALSSALSSIRAAGNYQKTVAYGRKTPISPLTLTFSLQTLFSQSSQLTKDHRLADGLIWSTLDETSTVDVFGSERLKKDLRIVAKVQKYAQIVCDDLLEHSCLPCTV